MWWSLRDKRMALRDGIDTDYDEGDQFEEETVRESQLNILLNFEISLNSDLTQVEFLIKEEETIIQD